MFKRSARKYVYKTPELKVDLKPLKDELNVFNEFVSDEDALFKANLLTVEEQRDGLNSAHASNYAIFEKNCTNKKTTQETMNIQNRKESRVPGLYGCNRYKSRRNVQVKETESFCFF
ncbi:hypothetical protein [Vibrio parahaemolyticus]|uniref:hypothetical protein n=1 Tax=Vibrio parahaemolyticus TaxID=670 RepID=UPI00387B127E